MKFSVRSRAAGKLALISSAAALSLAATAARAADATAVVGTGGDWRPRRDPAGPALQVRLLRMDVVTSGQIDLMSLADVGSILAKSVPGLYLSPQSGPFSYNLRLDPGLAPERDPLSDRRGSDLQPALQHHPAARHGAGPHGRSHRGAGQRPGPVLRHLGRRRRDQHRHPALHRHHRGPSRHRGRHQRQRDGQWLRLRSAIGGSKLVAYASYDEYRGFQPYPDADYQPGGTSTATAAIIRMYLTSGDA